jgi:hypothetical protein
MHKTLQVAARVAILGFVMLFTLAASPAFAQQKGKPAPAPDPNKPIVATFSDLTNVDNVMSDGQAYGFYTLNPNGTWEGAYINASGSIDINLTGTTTRSMKFDLDQVGSIGDACYLPGGTYVAKVVDFRLNPFGSQAGILDMAVTVPPTSTSGFGGTVNFTPTPALKNTVNGVTWTVSRLTLLYGPLFIDDPSHLTFTRNDTNLWTLTSTAKVAVQCMVTSGKRSVVYNPVDSDPVGASFSMTVSLK